MVHKLSLSFDMENDAFGRGMAKIEAARILRIYASEDFVLDVTGMTESDYQREMGE